MILDQLRDFYEHKPFQPFQIILDSGDKLIVTHPEYIAFSEDHVHVMQRDPLPCRTAFFEPSKITFIESVSLPKNSSRKRRRR